MSFRKPISPKCSPIFIYNEITPVSGYIASTKAESQFSLCPGLQGMKPHVKFPFSIWTTSNIHIFVCFFPSATIKGSAKFSHLLYYPLNQPCTAIRCLTQCAMSVPAKYGHCALHWTKSISALWHLINLHSLWRKKKGFQALSMLKGNRGHNVWCGTENLRRGNFMHRSCDISGLSLLIWCLSFFF